MFSVSGLQNGLTLPAWDYSAQLDKFAMLETGSSEKIPRVKTSLAVLKQNFTLLKEIQPVDQPNKEE